MNESGTKLTLSNVLEQIDKNYHHYVMQAYNELEAAMNLGKAQKYDEAQEHIGAAHLNMGAARALEEMHYFIEHHENDGWE